MKINIIDSATHQPYANRAVLVQLKDQEARQIKSTLTLRSSQEGALTLDQKFEGMQISASVNGVQSEWVKAKEGAVIKVEAAPQAAKTEKAGTFSNTEKTNTNTLSQNTQTQATKQPEKPFMKSNFESAKGEEAKKISPEKPEKEKSL